MIARRIRVRGPQHASGTGKHRTQTKLVWHTDRLAALLGFAIGILTMVLVVQVLDLALSTVPC